MKIKEREHLSRVAALGCIACKKNGNYGTLAEIHHIREGKGKGQRATHFEVIPLCPYHHRLGPPGEAFHASPRRWVKKYGRETVLLKEVLTELYDD